MKATKSTPRYRTRITMTLIALVVFFLRHTRWSYRQYPWTGIQRNRNPFLHWMNLLKMINKNHWMRETQEWLMRPEYSSSLTQEDIDAILNKQHSLQEILTVSALRTAVQQSSRSWIQKVLHFLIQAVWVQCHRSIMILASALAMIRNKHQAIPGETVNTVSFHVRRYRILFYFLKNGKKQLWF